MDTKEPNPKYRKEVVLDETGNQVVEIILERAVTFMDQLIGLMGRTSLAENEGMVFIDEYENMQGIWMKDTSLCLDIIFLDRWGNVTCAYSKADPFDEEVIYYPLAPSKFVIEMNGGFCEKYGIVEGFKIVPIHEE